MRKKSIPIESQWLLYVVEMFCDKNLNDEQRQFWGEELERLLEQHKKVGELLRSTELLLNQIEDEYKQKANFKRNS